jgi:gas vesicle protein
MSASNRLVWFLAGASIGATFALLFAPQSGEETRRYLGQQARYGRRKLERAGREALEQGRELFERGRDLADEAAELVEEGIGRARRTFQG